MKHATVNTIVGVLGLLIATITAISQFWPEADKLQVVIENRAHTGERVEFDGFGLLRPYEEKLSPSFGPVSWKLRIFNSTDRVISVVRYRIFQLSEDGSRIGSNSFNERLVPIDASIREQKFPLNIEAREANGYLLSLMVPYVKETDGERSCSIDVSTIRQFENCFFARGRDLFGNPVNAQFDNSEPPRRVSVQWSGSTFSPRFLIEFETASGALFNTQFAYYPF